MGVAVRFVGDRIEAPDPVGPRNAMGQFLSNQPVQRAVQRHPVMRYAKRGQSAGHFVVAQGATGLTQYVKDRRPGSGAAAAFGTDSAGGIGWCRGWRRNHRVGCLRDRVSMGQKNGGRLRRWAE